MRQKFVRGVVVSGTGQASAHKVDAFPHVPGSLNVFVGGRDRTYLLNSATTTFPSTRSMDKYLRVKLFNEKVWAGFSRDRECIELFAPFNFRETYNLSNGDIIKVFL